MKNREGNMMGNNKYCETSIYIHIPFCVKKCNYCDFPSYAGKEALMQSYVESLCKEISSLKNLKVETIYIGGGTPTYLSLSDWRLIGDALKRLNISSDVEFTVEANPGTFSKEKLKVLKDIGVNRLSIGLQAWQDSLLKRLGRIHEIKDFINAYNMAREAGFNNINIDLMFGIPDQTMEMWIESLKSVAELNPEHISCYSLIVEEGTPFYDEYEKGGLILPGEEVERDMYNEAINFLMQKGYVQYEISNFSKPGRECRHNMVYWSMSSYIGCGAGAHSYYEGLRYSNSSSIEKYIKKIEECGAAAEGKHLNTVEDELEEFIFMGLRMNRGISMDEFSIRFQKDIFDIYGTAIKKFIKNGLLVIKDNRLFLSRRGMEVSNSIMCEFILTS
jgi:oxygen-independent coproporphyrinogen III oxidase